MSALDVYIGDEARAREQFSFDALPRRLRDLINDAPVSFENFVIEAHGYILQGATVAQLEEAFMSAIRANAPGWTPFRQTARRRRG